MLDLPKDRAFVIAEAGTCHASPNRSERLWRAKHYVFAARNAGADCIKFQMFDKGDLFCPYPGDDFRRPRWLDSRLDFDGWCQVKEFAEACGLVFMASAFEYSTVGWLNRMGVAATKVASRAVKEFPYHEAPNPYLVSLGMVDEPPNVNGAIFLECESKYPSTAKWKGEHPGFSDHSGTPDTAIDAIARGCRLVEVHFYIDPIDAGPDLPASLNLHQLSEVCRQ